MPEMTSHEMKSGDRMIFKHGVPATLVIDCVDGTRISAQMHIGAELEVITGTTPVTVTINDWDGPALTVVE